MSDIVRRDRPQENLRVFQFGGLQTTHNQRLGDQRYAAA